jgi:hypothetical protein
MDKIAIDRYPTGGEDVNERQALPPTASRSTPMSPWGPFGPTQLERLELAAQLRCIAGILACHCGSAHPLIDLLHRAESDSVALQHAAVQFDRLPSLSARKIVSTFGAVCFRRRVAP